ncbi:hypothetical protein ACYSNR_00915 [Enterococcus sp. LJL128]
MKVEFLGLKQQARKSGCSSCGKRRVSQYNFQREKRMTLPSGRIVTFRAGEKYEVIEHDGLFLIDQVYHLNGVPTRMFKKVT